MNVDVLAFGAHPDDTELGCSGTLAKLVKQGKKVVVVDLTQGEMGSRGTVDTRWKEAQNAGKILGLTARDNLGLPDSELANTREFQIPIIERIRHYQPHICLISAPSDRHPDHGHASSLLVDALYFSGLRKIETLDPQRASQVPHRPAHILHYMQDRPFEPDFIFDISDTINLKEKAIKAFTTQFNVEDPGDEPETYISDPEYFESMKARARHFGHLGGFTFGEPFKYAQKPVPLETMNLFFETSPKR
ncbi:MAG: bacillithiol biosynthesis deacetylase BshB1 [Balneolaceae bacterium]